MRERVRKYRLVHRTADTQLKCEQVQKRITESLPTLPISLEIIATFEKIYDGEPILTVISNIGEHVYNTVVSIKFIM